MKTNPILTARFDADDVAEIVAEMEAAAAKMEAQAALLRRYLAGETDPEVLSLLFDCVRSDYPNGTVYTPVHLPVSAKMFTR